MNNVKKLYKVTFPAVEVVCMLTVEEAANPKKFLPELADSGWIEQELVDLLFSPTSLPRVNRIINLGCNSMPTGYTPTDVPWLGDKDKRDVTITDQLRLDMIQDEREKLQARIAKLQEELLKLG